MGKLYCRILQAAAKGPFVAISGASAADKISLFDPAEFVAAVGSGKIEGQMKSIIVGTAGHIDHGKTALVKALTGIDADRLEEEKRRGITIDLGFAHMELTAPSGEKIRIGFVDVPGHEKFVRNMLAGVGGIDLVLLVIAADEGVMPQTREHLEILKLLDVRRGITVLTKKDAVDQDMLDVVRIEVDEFLSGTFLEDPSPVIAISSLTGAGIDELRRALVAEALQAESRDAQAIPRLPIDRVFTMKGFGTVVTGTLIAGSIRREDELEIYPGEKRIRVRGIQVHGELAERANAGQRTALNLAGAATEELSRGMMLVPPRIFETTHRIDVKLHLLPSAPRPLKNRARVHFHSYTMESTAEILLLKDGRLDSTGTDSANSAGTDHSLLLPGHSTLARLKLSSPALLLPGDHFIIREFSPVITIGGGIILDSSPVPRSAQTAAFLRVLDEGGAEKILQARIARRGREGISLSQLISETGWTKAKIQAALAQSPQAIRVGDRFVDKSALLDLRSAILREVEAFQQRNPLVGAMPKEELREQVKTSSEVFDAALGDLLRERKIEVVGDAVRLPGRGVVLKDEESESKTTIENAFASAGLQVPALKEVIAGLKVDKARAQKIVTLLLREKLLLKVSEDLVFHRAALDDLRQKLASYKSKSARIDVGQFKELTGVTRKYAIPLLEYFDRERVTRRVGDTREIL